MQADEGEQQDRPGPFAAEDVCSMLGNKEVGRYRERTEEDQAEQRSEESSLCGIMIVVHVALSRSGVP